VVVVETMEIVAIAYVQLLSYRAVVLLNGLSMKIVLVVVALAGYVTGLHVDLTSLVGEPFVMATPV
jgi:hypothetical protein